MFEIIELDSHNLAFPDPNMATKEGLLAFGGDLSVNRLLSAYASGIFPWYSDNEPILWWSPNPRFVLLPNELVVHKSMKPLFNQSFFQVTFEHDFEYVINQCGKIKRNGQHGTWITKEMKAAYIQLFELGIAHSVEVWQQNKIVGGLYGVALGKIFFGESMFTTVSNASKYGFITLVRFLQKEHFKLIDCQQETLHLGSLGAKPMPRQIFMNYLKENVQKDHYRGKWKNT